MAFNTSTLSSHQTTGSGKPLSRTDALVLISLVGVMAVLAIAGGCFMGHIFTQSDAGWYLKIAEGQTASVLAPFSSRELGPLVVRGLAHIPGIDIHTAFIIEGVLSLLVLLAMVGWMLIKAGTKNVLIAAVAGLSLWPFLFKGLVLPDLFFSALLAVFLLLLARNQFLACALMFVPLWMSREAAIVALVCFLAAGWRRLRLSHSLTAVAASIAGIGIVRHLVAGGPGNREHFGFLLYMTGKVPWNIARNLFGIVPWMNLRTEFCKVPVWQVDVHFGSVTAVGICGWDPIVAVTVIRAALATFGLLPILLVYVWKKEKRALWPESPMLRFCVLYGLISVVLAPTMGTSSNRYINYAWPLFALALPMIVSKHVDFGRSTIVAGLLITHIALSWSLVPFNAERLSNTGEIASVVLIGVIYAVTWILLRQARISKSSDLDRPDPAHPDAVMS
jgi:hypothetical protein